jgi:hypothetical protein
MKFVMYMSKGRGYFHDIRTGAYEVRFLTGFRRLMGWVYDLLGG